MNGETPPVEALVGSVLEGRYRIVALLGRGGMGAVYEACQLPLNKRMAVKVMARDLTANSEALARFWQEAQVTSAMNHPHIVQVYDFGKMSNGAPFMVMEFLEGEDLEHRLQRTGSLSPEDTLHVIRQVAGALAATHLHAKAIVHRDLKPANVFLLQPAGEPDFVKVLDFGISKVRDSPMTLTTRAVLMGTPNYMSPEQALGLVKEIDERTDQWALACIAWECLAGVGPFAGGSVNSILFRVAHEPPPPLMARIADERPEVVKVLLRALAKNKTDRFSSVTEFFRAFETAMTGVSLTVLVSGPTDSSGKGITVEPLMLLDKTLLEGVGPPSTLKGTAGPSQDPDGPPRKSRRRWLVAGGGVAVTLLVGTLLWIPHRPKPQFLESTDARNDTGSGVADASVTDTPTARDTTGDGEKTKAHTATKTQTVTKTRTATKTHTATKTTTGTLSGTGVATGGSSGSSSASPEEGGKKW